MSRCCFDCLFCSTRSDLLGCLHPASSVGQEVLCLRKDQGCPSWGLVFAWISDSLYIEGSSNRVFCRAGAPKTGPEPAKQTHFQGRKNSWFWLQNSCPFHRSETDPIVEDSITHTKSGAKYHQSQDATWHRRKLCRKLLMLWCREGGSPP
jgi:hypothetical protein